MDPCVRAQKLSTESGQVLELLRARGVPRAAIDRGVKRADFHSNRSKPHTVAGTRGNGKLEAGEIFSAAIDRLEDEEYRFAHSGGVTKRPFTDLVSRCSSFRVPWIFGSFAGDARADQKLLEYLMGEIDLIRKRITGAEPGSVAYRQELLDGIVLWLEKMLDRRGYVRGERTNVEMLKGAAGDCTELSRFAYAILKLAGFKPELLLVHENMRGRRLYHVCVGVPLDSQRSDDLVQVDLSHDGFSARGEKHRVWYRAPAHTMLAIFESNRGWHLSGLRDKLLKAATEGSLEPVTPMDFLKIYAARISRTMAEAVASVMIHHYKRAMVYDPYFPEPYYNKAWTLFTLGGRDAQVANLARKAVDLNPNMNEAKFLLARLNTL